jgi:hypothetical protein
VGFVIVLEDYNFTPKTLFHLPNFGEGIDTEINIPASPGGRA